MFRQVITPVAGIPGSISAGLNRISSIVARTASGGGAGGAGGATGGGAGGGAGGG
ncbi:hypothetical protein ES703_84506 [subsurface metagenome]